MSLSKLCACIMQPSWQQRFGNKIEIDKKSALNNAEVTSHLHVEKYRDTKVFVSKRFTALDSISSD